ncbi:hypothetical protein [Desulfoferrobacter suflitae]|uniref:hypothetical protein n=1 Tax=Desulfoferrobacter suflitae TaxID=2865782 RepID=UPI0021647D55|nr:hypothetical protein [Desulfoferrobacter suflitae]MCK8603086.1 hypothetical protein [Desulfoferrobacter suflitae]
MSVPFVRTMESPCRSCENVHLSKEECSRECVRLKAFQEAIVHCDEHTIQDFGVRYGFVRG